MAGAGPQLVLCTYQAREGAEEELAGALRTHVARLLELGLMSDRPHFVASRPDKPGAFVEQFWWTSPGAAQQAADNSEVQELWMRLEDLCVPDGLQRIDLQPLD